MICLILCFVFPLSAELIYSVRSGRMNDEDIEEPLSAKVKEYEDVLNTSNTICSMMKENKYQLIYRMFFSDELKMLYSNEQYKEFTRRVESTSGKIVNYKPMQWYFIFKEENKKQYIWSIKIVKHKSAILYYAFVFPKEHRNKIVGFHVTVKNANSLQIK